MVKPRDHHFAGGPPRRLIVLGGRVVGVEMAQAWASLGSQATVIEALERLLPREEPFAGEQVREALEQLGAQVHTCVSANAVSRDGQQIRVRLEGGEEVQADRLLVAIGRKPLTHNLGLESVGLPSGGYIEVDDHMEVIGASGLYAVGDVNGRSLLTHMGKYQARVAADHILGGDAVASADGSVAPRVVFTDPQVAAVGLTLASALHAGISAEPFDAPTGGTAGASFYGRGAPGTTRFVVDAEREVLVGATFVGPGSQTSSKRRRSRSSAQCRCQRWRMRSRPSRPARSCG